MLKLRGISKQYKTGAFTQKVLDKLDLTLRDNEFVAILGQSGSGKTTLLNIIGALSMVYLPEILKTETGILTEIIR